MHLIRQGRNSTFESVPHFCRKFDTACRTWGRNSAGDSDDQVISGDSDFPFLPRRTQLN